MKLRKTTVSKRGARWACGMLVLLCVSTTRAGNPDTAAVQRALKDSGITGGLVVHLGCGDGKLTVDLRLSERYAVHGLDADPVKVAEARKHIRSRNLYGPVSVDICAGDRLPYVDNLVRVLVVSNAGGVPRPEIMRVLCPGGAAVIDGKPVAKPWPDTIDEWPQHFHSADNNAVSKDTVVGPPRHYQWIAWPEWSRSHLELPSINSLVSARGRLFSIEDCASAEHPALPGKFELVCRDAFNGIVLWRHKFPDWHPVNIYIKYTPAQLQRQLAAIGDRVYCTPGLDAPLTVFDAATGKMLKKYEGTERTQEFAYDDGVLFVVVGDPYDTSCFGRTSGTIVPAQFDTRAYGPIIEKKANPVSSITAMDAETGRKLWEKSGDDTRAYEGTSLAVKGQNTVFATARDLVCLDSKTGEQRWRVSLSGQPVGQPGPAKQPAGKKRRKERKGGSGRRQPGGGIALVISDDAIYLANGRTLRAFSMTDGKEMWTGATHLNHYKSPDIFLVGGTVWTANKQAYDARTGKPVKTLSQKMTGPMSHDRCYRNRITERWYINSVTGGSDFLGLDGSGEFPNPWIRSTCGIGGLPCNGLYYAGPPACSCCNSVQLNAFNAMSAEPGLEEPGQAIPVEVKPRLEKGPAYAAQAGQPSTINHQPSPSWPTYRHDITRGGCTPGAVLAKIKEKWQAKVTSCASAPVIADGKVLVSDIDAHLVCALDAGDGTLLWQYETGARVDSPPTCYAGNVLFGSRDGWVYSVRAADGVLAWRFRALPDRRICAYEQVESVWPVCGSMLVREDVAYFTAGRNSFTDGGLFLFGLDPKTGKVVHQKHVSGPLGQDGFPIIAKHGNAGFNILGHKGDVMLADDRFVYLRHQAFKPDLTPVDGEKVKQPHLITSHGFTEAVPHHRSFWTIDTFLRYDIPTGQGAVRGDILVKDGPRYYEVRGYQPSRTAAFDPRKGGYTLFAGEITTAEANPPAGKPPAKGKKRRPQKSVGVRAKELWTARIPLTGKAMVKAADVLFIAGTPVAFPEDDLHRGYEGRMGGVLWAASAADGKKLAQYTLDAAPAWDSLAVAGGCLYLCTTDGKVRCFAAGE